MTDFGIALGYPKIRAHEDQWVVLPEDDRLRHVYVIGRTGTGKSTFLKSQIIQDIHAGRGVCLIDPHGDLAESIIDAIPKSRVRETVYLSPQDIDRPMGFNPLYGIDERQRSTAVSNIISAFHSLWGDSWGYQMEDILRHTLYALLEYPKDPGVTLLAIPRFLNDERYRSRVLRHVSDPRIRQYWLQDFPRLDKQQRNKSVAAILNKLGAYFASPVLRNIIGQVQTTFDLGTIVNEKGILIVNLSKGLLGESDANLLGSMIVSSIQQVIMKRADILEEDRVPFYCYIDEFQNFQTSSFNSILSEARKFALSLTLANQFLSQIADDTRSAILGNAGTLVAFNISAGDADYLADEFNPFQPDMLSHTPKGEALVRMCRDGIVQDPVVMKGMLLSVSRNSAQRIKNYCGSRYGRDRKQVEKRLERWLGEGVRILTPRTQRRGISGYYA